MSLTRPLMLGLLALLPLWIWLSRRIARRRREDLQALGATAAAAGGRLSWTIAGWTALVIALAGPRLGRDPNAAPPPGHDVLFVMDVSRSMGVQDAAPDRMGLAVEAAEKLVTAIGREPGARVGLVAFAGRGVLRCPLTENLGAVVDVLRSLEPGSVRPGETDLGGALQNVARILGEGSAPAEGRSVILISDGEDLAGNWRGALPALERLGVVVHAIGVGDAELGGRVPAGPESWIRHEGSEVVSRRVDATLRGVAEATGGAWLPLGLASPDGIDRLYTERIQGQVSRQRRIALPSRRDRYSWFAVLGLGMIMMESWHGWRGGRRAMALAALLALATGAGPGSEAARGLVQQGITAFERGDLAEAEARFTVAAQVDPESAVARYNLAATHFRLGNYVDAATNYIAAREHAGPLLTAKIDFALGNAALALGDVPRAIAGYDACLDSVVTGPEADRVRADARINREFAQKILAQAEMAQGQDDSTGGGEQGPSGDTAESAPAQAAKGNEPTPTTNGGENSGETQQDPTEPGGETEAGQSSSPDPEAAGTPEEQLERALDRARRARERRLDPDDTARASPARERDW